MSAKFTSQMLQFVSRNAAAMDQALANMSIDIERLSKMQVPHDTGSLQNSGSVKRKGFKSYEVRYDKPYARRHEYNEGGVDSLGRAFPPSNFKKGRKSRFLRDPGEMIAAKAVTYFKQAAASLGA